MKKTALKKRDYSKNYFRHRDLKSVNLTLPAPEYWGIIPGICGLILGVILGAVSYFHWAYDLIMK
ncbi:MAG: hypothetical protein WC637_06610 [Victivallales bacterium]|jgi:hypothetical protein